MSAQVLMGLDYGAKTVGVAVSDPLGLTAQAAGTIVRERETKLRRTLAQIDELIAERGVTMVNPGALKYGKYAIVTLDDGIIGVKFCALED